MKIDDLKNGFNGLISRIKNSLSDDDLREIGFIFELIEEKQPPQLTERERAYLKAYSYDYEWVARDDCGELFVYKLKPSKFQATLSRMNKNQKLLLIDNDMLDFIKWEDEEPYNIKDLLGDKE